MGIIILHLSKGASIIMQISKGSSRVALNMPTWLKVGAQQAAKEKGVNLSEWIKDLMKYSLKNESKTNADDL